MGKNEPLRNQILFWGGEGRGRREIGEEEKTLRRLEPIFAFFFFFSVLCFGLFFFFFLSVVPSSQPEENLLGSFVVLIVGSCVLFFLWLKEEKALFGLG